MNLIKLNSIIHSFFINIDILNVKKIDSGLINQTFVVEYLNDGLESKFILQSISNIYESHEIVNMNHKFVTDHIQGKINKNFSNLDSRIWKVPSLIKCQSNNLFSFPFESNYWRAMVFIDEAISLDCLDNVEIAYEIGLGLSKFHFFCSDLDYSKLKKSLKNFHNINYYIDQYSKTLDNFNFNKLDNEVRIRTNNLINYLSNHIQFVDSLLPTLTKISIDKNIIHGDPKLSNFLFDIQQKYVVSLIDLDTVGTGNLLTDLADCIRSICNPAGEDPIKNENVCFDINTLKYFLNGYFSINNEQKMQTYGNLLEFIYLIIFELTIRFLTDYLQSNRYFKIKYETHNLFRAEVQCRLLSSFLVQISNLSILLDEMGIRSNSSFVSDVQKLF
tara:strand:+ start:3635 stop:4798 length:1164 start_codon:yes stop_codon:yes gene_type:complete